MKTPLIHLSPLTTVFPGRRARRFLAGGFVLMSAALAGACAGGSASTASSPDVWASVDDREIRREAVELAYRRLAPQTPEQSPDEVLATKLGIVDQLIDQEVLLARAGTLTIEVTDAELEKAFSERKGNMPDDVFQKELNQRGLTTDDMRAGLRKELIVQKLMEREVGSKIAISDQDIREFYDKNRAQFNVAETQYRIAQIVITPAPGPVRNRLNDDATSPAEAQRKVEMLMERLRGGGDFAALAMDYSEDPQSAPQGGDLGFVPASALAKVPPQLRDVVLKAEPGSVSTVSAAGAHTLVFLAAREAAGQRELSTPAVRDGISTLLRDRKEQLLRTAYVTAARDEAKVVNHLARQLVDAKGAMPGLVPAAPGK